jgi:hypothetical protein
MSQPRSANQHSKTSSAMDYVNDSVVHTLADMHLTRLHTSRNGKGQCKMPRKAELWLPDCSNLLVMGMAPRAIAFIALMQLVSAILWCVCVCVLMCVCVCVYQDLTYMYTQSHKYSNFMGTMLVKAILWRVWVCVRVTRPQMYVHRKAT